MELTQNGLEYLYACEKILREIKEAETNLLREQNEMQGKIRLGIPSVLGQRYLLPKLQNFNVYIQILN